MSNDANCAAYAESHHGAARGVAHALYLTGTVGIGAGIIQDGHLVRGGAGFAGEVGHMPVGDSAALCGCGRRGLLGGLDRAARDAGRGRHARARHAPAHGRGGGRARRHRPRTSARGSRGSAATSASASPLLSSVLDPEVVVLGGYFAPLGDLVLEPARRTLDERLASAVQVRPELRLSTLGIQAAALGAAEQSLGPVFSGGPT